MTVLIENETNELPFDPEPLVKSVVEETLREESFPYEAEISVLFTDPETVRELNRTMRNIDRTTDVLSFPMAEYAAPGDYDSLESQDDVFDPETGECMLGDIVISVEQAKEQAEAYGHSLRREIAFLTAHSMLHLLGYDHMNEEEERVMFGKQEAILDNLGIVRES